MNCYICDQAPKSGTMHYAVNQAVGVCQHCGIGVCTKHSQRSERPGSPLVCTQCAALPTVVASPAKS